MPNLYSTKEFRRKNTRIPVEICPRLTIQELAENGLLGGANPKFFARKEVEGRIELVVHTHIHPELPDDETTMEVQFWLANREAAGWLYIKLAPTKSARARLSHMFICPGKQISKRGLTGEFSGCGKQVDTLYIPDYPGMCFLACRSCHGLTYLSRQVFRKSKKPRQPRKTPGLPPFAPPSSSHDAIDPPASPPN